MRIVHVEIRNFRGIKTLDWSPSPGMNCLIGPGDSTKTTVLDAIELTLNPRTNYLGDDADFYNLDFTNSITVTVTLVGIPDEFCTDNRYGLQLRGWDESTRTLFDEPADGLSEALSIRVEIDAKSLEGRWSIFNERLSKDADPPSLRFKDARELATTRLGPYAERHLGWGRQSILNRIGEGGRMSEQLAAASRAARAAFRTSNKDVFAVPTARAEMLGKHFAVRVREAFTAELDIQGSAITSGGVALHDGDLPLRTLGTGSSRLIVSALQHNASGSHIAMVDEIEHGLEPHRIARLLKYLLAPPVNDDDHQSAKAAGTVITPQIFLTTHSEVVIRELRAQDIHAVRSHNGETKVRSVALTAETTDVAQGHLRGSPESFLARRILVGEGRTECGLLRGLDVCWASSGKDSFALRGVVAIDGGGVPRAVTLAQHLLDLGYECLALLDTDEPPSAASVSKAEAAGGTVLLWPGDCSTDERIFLDVPWDTLRALVAYAAECHSADSIIATTNAACKTAQIPSLADLTLPASLESDGLRIVLGATAKKKAWFKGITYGEHVATLIYPCLDKISATPLAQHLAIIRGWVDA
ncbi:ATP-dependent nuclease [Labrys sp. ZIDIC5]|uniref:ATP-dependent nuclease n=1 Tax=Labrys sedimenti TaxID=3106036 RepID=UPI002ACA5204|nr:AAA family ATPase [Labrys sp. ZIDIC5]MDZ5450482.1 AAA family ATPase [Labrys sp. ZIDIC5]